MKVCPNCRAIYREGFVRCADCDADLIDSEHVTTLADETDSAVGRIWSWVLTAVAVGTIAAFLAVLAFAWPYRQDWQPLSLSRLFGGLGGMFVLGGLPGAVGGFLFGHLAERVSNKAMLLLCAPVVGAIIGSVYSQPGMVAGGGAALVTAAIRMASKPIGSA